MADAYQVDNRWFKAREYGMEPHLLIQGVLNRLRTDIQQRKAMAVRNAQMVGIDLNTYGLNDTGTLFDTTVSFNAAKNARDTVVAMTAKSRVIPQACTTGATWKEQRRAEEFNRAIEGLFDMADVWRLDPLLCSDALTFDMALAKVSVQNESVCVERVFPWQTAADPLEAARGWKYLRSFYQFHLVDRLVLMEMYKDDADARLAIESAVLTSEDVLTFGRDVQSDQVLIVEAWHLKSGPDAKDGKYCRCLPGRYTLDFEDYEKDRFPFVPLYQAPCEVGIYQVPMMTWLYAPQSEFDKNAAKIQEAFDLLGVPRIILRNGGKVNKSELDDTIGGIIHVDGNEQPMEWNAQPITPDMFNYNEGISRNMLRYVGVSEGSAHSQVPAGLSGASGKALQVYDDWESDRLSVFWRMREWMYIDLANCVLDCARDVSEDNSGFVVTVVDGRRIRLVKFKDIDISKDKYVLRVQPQNLLSKNPASKFAQVAELQANGSISPIEARKLMSIPDLVAQNELDTSMIDIIDKNIGAILEDGKMMTVLPFDDHKMIVDRGTKAINLARVRDEDQDKIDLLIQYVQQAYEYMKPPPAPPAPPGPPPMGAPTDLGPMPPPPDGMGMGPEPMPGDMGMGPPPMAA